MKILLSPTKKQVVNSESSESFSPFFINEATRLIAELKALGPDGTQKMLKISDAISAQNWERLSSWTPCPTQGSLAINTYVGEAFNYLNPGSFSESDLAYANRNLLVFSGLYGLLKPLDKIMPYRLDIKDPLKIDGKSLYEYWSKPLTNFLKEELVDCDLLLDLSSKEYSKSIQFRELPVKTITPEFKSEVNGRIKTVAIWSKRMRGLLAKEVIKYRITTEAELQDIQFEDYTLEECSKGKYLYIKRQ